MTRGETKAAHTPGPWAYVPSSVHHGPYVTSEFGSTICDCYTMSQPQFPSVANGGPSKPIPFLAEMSDPNARLIAAAPEMYEALERIAAMSAGGPHLSAKDGMGAALASLDRARDIARAALAKADTETGNG